MLTTVIVASMLAADAPLPPIPETPSLEAVCGGDPATHGDVGFDARNGSRFGPSHMGQTDAVTVVLYNKNPFLYEYRLAVSSAPTDLSQVVEFFKATGLKTMTPSRGAVGGACSSLADLYNEVLAARQKSDAASQRSTATCAELYQAMTPVIETARALVEAWNANAAHDCPSAEPGRDQVKEMAGAAGHLLDQLSRRDNFWKTVSVSIPDEPTTVTIDLYRSTKQDPAEEQVFHATVEVGTSLVTLSIGGAWLGLPVRNVVRQLHRKSDGSGELAFGFDEDSTSHFGVAAFLHGRILDLGAWGVLPRSEVTATFGVVLPTSGPPLDFVLGGSWGVSRTVYLTLGAEFAQVTHIGGGFREGDPIPDNQADPLPTRKKWEVGPAVGLSWRFR